MIRLPFPHPGQQKVRSEAQRFNWLSAGRRWRKTTLAMSIAVEAALDGGTYIWGAPTFDQVRIGFDETQSACAGFAQFNQSRMTATFPSTQGKIYFRSLDNPNNVRGYTADGVVTDEAGFVKQVAWTEVLRPMLMDTGGWHWGIGTPNGMNWFWQEFIKAENRSDSMTWAIPSLGCRINDRKLIREPHPYENPDLSFEEIKTLWEEMPERIFRQEILGEFLDTGGGVFRLVREAATAVPLNGPKEGHQYIAGVDVAALQDFTVVIVLDVHSKEMVFLDRFNRVDYPRLEAELEAIYRLFNLDTMIIESNSIGQPVIDHLLQRGLSIIPFMTTNATKTAAIQSLQAAFEHGQISILNHPILLSELLAFEGAKRSTYWVFGAPDGLHDDTVMALALAWSGLKYTTITPVKNFLFN